MKRKDIKKRILKVLKEWEGSKMELKTAEEILSMLENAGMVPAPIWRFPTEEELNKGFKRIAFESHRWEDENE